MQMIMVRHGQTAWNKSDRFRGRTDLPLDELGIRQAERAAERLSGCDATAVFASPLKRTMMTATPIAEKLGLTIQPTNDLIDIDYGAWQGLSTAEANEQDSDLFKRLMLEPQTVVFPNGEGLSDVRNRIENLISNLRHQYTEETVILVSHLVVCRVFICTVLGLGNSHFWQIGQDVCAINRVSVRNDKLVLEASNDTCHLKGLE